MAEDEAPYGADEKGPHDHEYTLDYAGDLDEVIDAARRIDMARRDHLAKQRAWEDLGQEILASGYEATRHGKKMRELLG